MSSKPDQQPLPARARRSGRFHLDLPPEEAFELFTAEGERRWVAGWDPQILSACDALETGAVFLTAHGGEETIWTVIEANRGSGRLLYSRVSPGKRAGIVEVKLEQTAGGTIVHVTYDMTALSPEGEEAVRSMDEKGFANMLNEWERLIRSALTRGP